LPRSVDLVGRTTGCRKPTQEGQQWRLGDFQRPVGTTCVPYDLSVETPDEGGTNGRLRGIQSVGESSPAECRLPFLSPAESLRPDLRLIHVNCPVPLLRHRSLAGDRLGVVKPRCALRQRRGTTSRHNVCYQYWLGALRRRIEARWLGHSWQRASSLRLAMGLTTILTTIWVCPPKSVTVQNPYLQGKSDVRGRARTRCRCLGVKES
jgi:hypothetical protein